MLTTLDTIIAIALVYMILSMANKFLMSFFKRVIGIKAGVMSKVLGDLVFKDLSGYLEKKDDKLKLGFIDDAVIDLGGFKKKNISPVIEVTKNIETFIKKENLDEIAALLGLGSSKFNPSEMRLKASRYRDAIAAKYNSAMDQVTEIYTKNLRYWAMGFGLIIAVAVNADFLDIYSSISTNAQLRGSLVESSQKIDFEELDKKLIEKLKEAKTNQQGTASISIAELEYIQQIKKPLEESGLKLGWTMEEWKKIRLSREGGWLLFLKKVIGLGISGLLIGFGAPFWHDLLRSVAGIKTVLKKKGKGEGLKVPDDD